MSLPAAVRVKISSEAAGSIGLTQVVVQDLPLEELIRLMLGVTGKDVARVRELLLRGSLVSGASRFRWQGFEADDADIAQYLTRYPGSDPSRIFDESACVRVTFRGGKTRPLAIEREAGSKRRLFRSRSFWDALMALAPRAVYVEYSYKEQADVYRVAITPDVLEALRAAAPLLAYSSFEKQIASGDAQTIDLYVKR